MLIGGAKPPASRMQFSFVSPYNTELIKYSGPYAIVSYEGPRNGEKQMEGEGKILYANGSTYAGYGPIHPYTPLYTAIHHLYTPIYPYTPLYTHIHPYTPLYTPIHPYTPIYTHSGVKADKMDGKGKLTSQDGSQEYDGEFEDDNRHGFATFRTEYGTYTGCYANNKRHGKGKEGKRLLACRYSHHLTLKS